jgi:hypothetical protein
MFVLVAIAIYMKGQSIVGEKEGVAWGYPKAFEHTIDYVGDSGNKFKVKIDKNGFRKIKGVNTQGRKHLIITGGSNAFGELIPDEETLSHWMSESEDFKDYNPYVLAYPGWAAHNLLKRFMSLDIRKIIPEEEGVLIYQFINDHVTRVCGGEGYFEWNHGVSPYYEVEGGRLVDKGFFKESFSFMQYTFNKGVRDLSPVKLEAKKIDESQLRMVDLYPPRCIKILATIIVELRKVYLKAFPRGKFVVMTYPVYQYGDDTITQELNSVLKSMWSRSGVDFKVPLDFFNKEMKRQGETRKTLRNKDNHVNGKYYKLMLPFYQELLD